MIKVILFSGNLGNQVFYCAFKDYIKQKYPNIKVYMYKLRWCPPVIVDKIFNLELPKENKIVNIISFILFYLVIFFRKILRIQLPSSIWCGRGAINERSVFYTNYLQDKYYYEKRNSDWLKIKIPIETSPEYDNFERLIKSCDAICVHIRRGDYIKQGSIYEDLSSTDYYQKALALAKDKFPQGKIFYFSDDLEFVKKNIGTESDIYVDCNRGENSFLDIKLMSLAKVNIMANSTFSYWGAYMGHEHKTVICPNKWFRSGSGRVAPNIMLDTWIKL